MVKTGVVTLYLARVQLDLQVVVGFVALALPLLVGFLQALLLYCSVSSNCSNIGLRGYVCRYYPHNWPVIVVAWL